jgi:hypothetical protein
MPPYPTGRGPTSAWRPLNMSRPFNPDLSTPWKLNMPATLAGKVEYLLLDPIHCKPIYGSRNRLAVALFEWWIAREQGQADNVHVPSLTELRERR